MGIQSQIHRLIVNIRSTAEFCETVADASRTFAGSFFESDGLIVWSAERIVVAAAAESMSTRRAARARNTCSWARTANSRIASSTGGVAMAADERFGDDRACGRDEVGRPGEPQRRLVRDVVADLLLLRRLGDDVAEAVVVEHAGVEPPAGRAERHEQHAQRGQQPHRPPAQALTRRGLALGAPGRRHVDDDRAIVQTPPPVSTIQPTFLSPGAAVSPHPLRTPGGSAGRS